MMCFVCGKERRLYTHHHYWPRKLIKKLFPNSYTKLRQVKHYVCLECHNEYHAKAFKCRRPAPCRECRFILICCYLGGHDGL